LRYVRIAYAQNRVSQENTRGALIDFNTLKNIVPYVSLLVRQALRRVRFNPLQWSYGHGVGVKARNILLTVLPSRR
jgi:hypothetical protein